MNSTDASEEDRWGRRRLSGNLSFDHDWSFGVFDEGKSQDPVTQTAGYDILIGENSCLEASCSSEDTHIQIHFLISNELFSWAWNELMSRPISDLCFDFTVAGYVGGSDKILYLTHGNRQITSVNITVADQLSPLNRDLWADEFFSQWLIRMFRSSPTEKSGNPGERPQRPGKRP
jgi:hypothetical protein